MGLARFGLWGVGVILSFGPTCGVALVSGTLPKRRCENQRDLSGKSGTFRDFSGLLRIHRWKTKKGLQVIDFLATPRYFKWRRHPDLNRGYAVLQTAALPLGYAAIKIDGFVKSPSAALRFILRHCSVPFMYASFLRIYAPCIWSFLLCRWI